MASLQTHGRDEESAGAFLKSVFREAKHLAGGFVHHPSESTKHYSILRHSIGFVYYKGPSTSLALTIFSSPSHPLPADRTLWLQPKGWLGKTGWRAKSFVGLEGDWLNVTPVTRAATDHLNPDDERAWQRDIKHFVQKGPSGHSRKHIVRETVIIRIPFEATDGYFRVILCTGPEGKRKTLCPSPEFRVASTSAAPSSVRGASLGTLPLELGAKTIATFTTGQVSTLIAPVTDAMTGAIQPYVQQVQPGFVAQEAITEGYSRTGLENRITQADDAYTTARDTSYDPIAGPAGSDDDAAAGPQAPYPIHITSQIVPGTGLSTATTSLSTANLNTLHDDLMHRLYGYYFGWARISKPAATQSQSQARSYATLVPHTGLDTDWHEAIISVTPLQAGRAISVVHSIMKSAAVHLIHDFGRGANLVGATVEIIILGFLHPPLEIHSISSSPSPEEVQAKEAALLAAVDDVALTQTYLSHPGWSISDILDLQSGKILSSTKRSQTLPATQEPGIVRPDQPFRAATLATGVSQGFNNVSNTMTDTYVNTRQGVQRQVDKIPFHLAGLRVGVDGLREKSIGQGGVYVIRG